MQQLTPFLKKYMALHYLHDQIIDKSPDNILHQGVCVKATEALAFLLKTRGYNSFELCKGLHSLVGVEHNGEKILVDPTHLQFFHILGIDGKYFPKEEVLVLNSADSNAYASLLADSLVSQLEKCGKSRIELVRFFLGIWNESLYFKLNNNPLLVVDRLMADYPNQSCEKNLLVSELAKDGFIQLAPNLEKPKIWSIIKSE